MTEKKRENMAKEGMYLDIFQRFEKRDSLERFYFLYEIKNVLIMGNHFIRI